MSTHELIALEVYCTHQGIDVTFVHSLHERGLILITTEREVHFIGSTQLARIEQLARMHYDLDINLEGIEAISHLLERMQSAQDDLRVLRERLSLYEGNS